MATQTKISKKNLQAMLYTQVKAGFMKRAEADSIIARGEKSEHTTKGSRATYTGSRIEAFHKGLKALIKKHTNDKGFIPCDQGAFELGAYVKNETQAKANAKAKIAKDKAEAKSQAKVKDAEAEDKAK